MLAGEYQVPLGSPEIGVRVAERDAAPVASRVRFRLPKGSRSSCRSRSRSRPYPESTTVKSEVDAADLDLKQIGLTLEALGISDEEHDALGTA